MTRTRLSCSIDAPLEVVFDTISDVRNFSRAVPGIAEIEFLSEQQAGVGTRFRETRLMRGRPASTILEVTEFAEFERIRLVADSHGTVWDSTFTVRPRGGVTELTLTMDARPRGLLARMVVPLTRGVVRRALEEDLHAVKRYCEEGVA